MAYSVPKNVVNKKLYKKIYNKIKKEHEKKGKRWGAYSSGQLVKLYKKAGGKYTGSKKNKNLSRWYKEKWIDVCAYPKIKSCGRKRISGKKSNLKNFPYCRPLHRVSKNTPKTVKELSSAERKKLCKLKRSNPKKTIKHKFNNYAFGKSRRKSRKSRRKSRKSRRKSRAKSRRKSRAKSNEIKLLSIKKSPKGDKKYRATFKVNDRLKHTDFGAKGMSDYTKHKDIERRSRYITRHKKDLRTNDPTRAGYLSMYVLWNKKTLQSSINDYKKRLQKYSKTKKFPLKIK